LLFKQNTVNASCRNIETDIYCTNIVTICQIIGSGTKPHKNTYHFFNTNSQVDNNMHNTVVYKCYKLSNIQVLLLHSHYIIQEQKNRHILHQYCDYVLNKWHWYTTAQNTYHFSITHSQLDNIMHNTAVYKCYELSYIQVLLLHRQYIIQEQKTGKYCTNIVTICQCYKTAQKYVLFFSTHIHTYKKYA